MAAVGGEGEEEMKEEEEEVVEVVVVVVGFEDSLTMAFVLIDLSCSFGSDHRLGSVQA